MISGMSESDSEGEPNAGPAATTPSRRRWLPSVAAFAGVLVLGAIAFVLFGGGPGCKLPPEVTSDEGFQAQVGTVLSCMETERGGLARATDNVTSDTDIDVVGLHGTASIHRTSRSGWAQSTTYVIRYGNGTTSSLNAD